MGVWIGGSIQCHLSVAKTRTPEQISKVGEEETQLKGCRVDVEILSLLDLLWFAARRMQLVRAPLPLLGKRFVFDIGQVFFQVVLQYRVWKHWETLAVTDIVGWRWYLVFVVNGTPRVTRDMLAADLLLSWRLLLEVSTPQLPGTPTHQPSYRQQRHRRFAVNPGPE